MKYENFIVLLVLTTLAACGGGNESSEKPSSNQVPFVITGPDLTVKAATKVTLNGNAGRLIFMNGSNSAVQR
ncbi:hypothetical protein [Pseudoalteromonas spongiae]|uniref:hypothetical protein n=1 Tax=Pseudoalteromonas spongiae TaxID=298657 RepID=UPI00110A4408|nr:hypothetical protein [Pseudoalteromonas spongiae]TMO84825.1 hypothetical protein CWC15_09585 [Pseudoalteromonas spongiae]